MALHKMTVTDAEGRDGLGGQTTGKTLAGTCVPVPLSGSSGDPYQFYAVDLGRQNPDAADVSTVVHLVTLVMANGGQESGLYRFPRVGETVLTVCEGGEYYLMGYIPSYPRTAESPAAAFTPVDGKDRTQQKVLKKYGQVLRYRTTGNLKTGGTHSELGFYRETSAWPATTGGTDFPYIDQVSLSSSGDLRETAYNHLLKHSKRMEVLVNVPEVREKDGDGGKRPLGDYPGDDSALHPGDFHLRAGNRVVIRADDSITLQVGRSILEMNNRGFNLRCQTSTGAIGCGIDASLDLSPRGGAVVTGRAVTLSAGRSLNVGDDYGGSLATMLGALRLSGRDLSFDIYSTPEYRVLTILEGLIYGSNMAVLSMALANKDLDWQADAVRYAFNNLKTLIEMARKLGSTYGKRQNARQKRLADAAEDAEEEAETPEVPDAEEEAFDVDDDRQNEDESEEYEHQRDELKEQEEGKKEGGSSDEPSDVIKRGSGES